MAEYKYVLGNAWKAARERLTLLETVYDTGIGRHLYHDVTTHGLVDVKAEEFAVMQLGGTPTARFWRVTTEEVQDHLLAAGLLTQAELEGWLTLLESSEYRWLSQTVIVVRDAGRPHDSAGSKGDRNHVYSPLDTAG